MSENRKEDPPRSGVAGLTPRQVRDRMLDVGWGVIPVTCHDGRMNAAGKRPGISKWERFAAFDDPQRPCDGQLLHWDIHTSDWPGTGLPCGEVIAIDLDARDPVLAAELEAIAFDVFGVTPFVRVGSAPKRALVYRAAEPIAKQAFKFLDRSDDGLDIQGEGAHVVAFGIHPRTGRIYDWTGAESPLTIGPEAAPSIDRNQVESFLNRVRVIVELSKGGGRKGGKGGSAEIKRNPATGLVEDGRETHCYRTVWRILNLIKSEGGDPLDIELSTDRAFACFAATTDLEAQGRPWTRANVRQKVDDALKRVRQKKAVLGTAIEAAEPTHPDTRVYVPEAEASVRSGVEAFFQETRLLKNRKVLFDLGELGKRGLPPLPFAVALNTETGIGKSTAARGSCASAVRSGLRLVYAIPTTDRGDEFEAAFRALGINARVYRGRDKPDPDALDHLMCRNIAATEDALQAGVPSIYGSVCEQKRPGEPVRRCPFFDVCGHVRQRSAKPDLWIVPHKLLFLRRPAFISEPDAIVFDESFHRNAIADPVALALDLRGLPLPTDALDRATLASFRQRLSNALVSAPDGFLPRSVLAEAGITAQGARDAREIEQKLRRDPMIFPGQDPRERSRLCREAGEVNKGVRARTSLATEIANFLDGDADVSGRISLGIDKGTRKVFLRTFTPVDASWGGPPALVLDATAPPASILSPVLGVPVKVIAPIVARWSERVRVRQYLGAPVSANKLGIVDGAERRQGEPFFRDLRRLIERRAAEAFPRFIAVVGQKKAIARLLEFGLLPSNVDDPGNFGALAGMDRWRDFAGIIVFGQPQPPVSAMESDAGCITGAAPGLVARPIDGSSYFYPKAPGGIRLSTGAGVFVDRYVHPDPIAEALRHQGTEAELLQAIGRIRPHRRTAENACFVDLISDVPLPITVDEVVVWGAARPDASDAMAEVGVILTNARDAEIVYPTLAASRKASRTLVEGSTAPRAATGARLLRYKRRGGHPMSEAHLLPNAFEDEAMLKAYVLPKLGPFDHFELVDDTRGKEGLGPAAATLRGWISERGLREIRRRDVMYLGPSSVRKAAIMDVAIAELVANSFLTPIGKGRWAVDS